LALLSNGLKQFEAELGMVRNSLTSLGVTSEAVSLLGGLARTLILVLSTMACLFFLRLSVWSRMLIPWPIEWTNGKNLFFRGHW